MEGVQFILGRSGTGKTRWCMDAVCDALAGGDGPLILLVPEQATYQAERSILSRPDISGFSRLRILSFNRLQFWLDSGRGSGSEISRTGKQMVLQKLLLELSEKLSLYRGPQQRSGLAEKLSGLFTEFQQSDCMPEQIQALATAISKQAGQEIAAAKWADIALLYEQYLQFFNMAGSEFVNPDIGLKDAAGKVGGAKFLKNATLWVDGFSGFSVQERDLLIELVKVCKRAHIALCLDPKMIDLANTDDEKLDPFSLFTATEETYTNLLRIFKACKFPCKEPVILDKPMRFKDAAALAYLEENLLDSEHSGNATGAKNIRIASCSNVRAESVWVGRVIRKLAKEHAMRYRDIAVVVPDINTYAHYIESAFTQYDIPYFLDRPRNMKTHPVTTMIGAALQAVQNGFALSDVLSFLKSDFAGIDPEAVDVLENYCRAFDVQKSEWTRKKPWDFADTEDKKHYDEKQLDALRKEAIKPLQNLRQNLNSQDTITAGQFTQAIWQLLEELEVQKKLADWSASDTSDQVYGHRQLFAKLVELLDEMCGIFGEQEMAAGVWSTIFSDALSVLTIKLIPPTLDQVLVGSIERSRHPDIKAIFLVGATQKQFPVPLGQENLLAEEDYRFAADSELELTNPYQNQLVHRQYLTYIAMTRASKYLFISHPLLDEKGASVVPWSGIEQLLSVFGDLEPFYPQGLAEGPEAIATDSELAQWLCASMGKDRGTELRNQKSEVRKEDIAAGVLERMMGCGHESLEEVSRHVKTALAYDNAGALDAELTKRVFQFPMTTSVTRLGTFAACPYQYFAKYILRLDKRKLLRFEPMDIGIFYHAVLEMMFKSLHVQQKDWADASEAELVSLCEKTIAAFLENDVQIANFIRRNAHHRYIIEAAGQTLKDFVITLREFRKASLFKQTAAELEFGPDKDIQLTIKRGPRPFISFRGKIDRLDIADIDGQTAGVVFDFKRTSRSANFAKMLYGLDLQLPVYLLAIREKRGLTPLIPVGAFYLPIEGGVESKPLSQLGQEGTTLNKAKGLFDGRFTDSLDTAAGGGWNRYYNFFISKDGPYGNYASSGALKPEDFDALLKYTVECVKKLVEQLADGKIDITPYRLGTGSPCSWCDYRSLCRFDWQVNEYNILESCDKEEALEKMKAVKIGDNNGS